MSLCIQSAPNTQKVLFWGQTRADQARMDYSARRFVFGAANQTADLTGNINNSDLWSSATNCLIHQKAGDHARWLRKSNLHDPIP